MISGAMHFYAHISVFCRFQYIIQYLSLFSIAEINEKKENAKAKKKNKTSLIKLNRKQMGIY